TLFAIGSLVHASRLFPGSSAVEQPAVNRLVDGSNPSRGATLKSSTYRKPILPEGGHVGHERTRQGKPWRVGMLGCRADAPERRLSCDADLAVGAVEADAARPGTSVPGAARS